MQFGLIGEKLTHSFSKEIHELFSDYEYDICELSENELKDFISSKNYKGINVTIPYKKAVMPFLDYISEEAKEIGCVNTVVNRNGKLCGYNTDAEGFNELLSFNKITVKDKNVAVLGSGGTCLTVFYVLKKLKAKEIRIISRQKKDFSYTYDEFYEKFSDDTDIIINTTPVGMFPELDNSPVNLSKLKNVSAVVDIVYNPIRTKLLEQAEQLNIKNCNGLYMLVSQAASAFRLFTERKLGDARKTGIYYKILNEKTNIVLIGMPGSGKTTLGKKLSENLNRKFVDTDMLITEKFEKPSEIIKKHGEEYFRKIEADVIKEASLLNSCVISTGGGAVLNQSNMEYLKRNGKIIFINRDISKIKPSVSRPLSSDKEKLEKLYFERYPLYKKHCDVELVALDGIEETFKELEKLL